MFHWENQHQHQEQKNMSQKVWPTLFLVKASILYTFIYRYNI